MTVNIGNVEDKLQDYVAGKPTVKVIEEQADIYGF